MRINIEIDDTLMAEAQKACGGATKKRTVEEALRLMVNCGDSRRSTVLFGKYRWRANLPGSRSGREIG